MTRIALIAGTYQPERCGVAHYTARLRTALAAEGIETIVLTTHAAAQAAQDPNVIGAVSNWHLSDLLPLVQAIYRTKADLLHIQHAAGTYGFDRALFLLPLLLRASGWQRPIVTTVHEYGWWEWQPPLLPSSLLERLKTWGQYKGWWDREDGFLLTQSDAIITTNSDADRVLLQRLPDFADRIYRIPIGANVEAISVPQPGARQWVRQVCGWAEETTIVAFFGFLHPVKGLELLLSAFQQVVAVQPQTRLLLIGGVESLALRGDAASQYWETLEARIASLNLQAVVHRTGYLDPAIASQYLAGCDIGVLPFNHGVTLKSGSLLTLLGHELPVIATRANPPDPELEQAALVLPIAPRDSESLTQALLHLLSDRSLQTRLARAGQQFSRQFAWPSIADRHLQVYQTVLPQPRITPSRSVA